MPPFLTPIRTPEKPEYKLTKDYLKKLAVYSAEASVVINYNNLSTLLPKIKNLALLVYGPFESKITDHIDMKHLESEIKDNAVSMLTVSVIHNMPSTLVGSHLTNVKRYNSYVEEINAMMAIPNMLHTILSRYNPNLMSAEFYSEELFDVVKEDGILWTINRYYISDEYGICCDTRSFSDPHDLIAKCKDRSPEVQKYFAAKFPESLL